MTSHLRMNAVYWGLTAVCIMKRKEALDAEEMIEYVMSCWDDNAGNVRPLLNHWQSTCQPPSLTLVAPPKRCFRRTPRTRRAHPLHAKRHPNPSHAKRPLASRPATHNRLYVLSRPVPSCVPSFPLTHPTLTFPPSPPPVILGLQQPSGVFAGDAFGETDTRFLYCAVSALSLLGSLDRLDRARTVSYLASCRNFDGGFGRVAGAESHAAQG